MNYLIVHTIGNTSNSIFTLELQKNDGSVSIYYVDPTESTKFNRLFNPFKPGSSLELALESLQEDIDNLPPPPTGRIAAVTLSINKTGSKLLPGLTTKTFPDKHVSEMTTLEEYTPPEVETLYEFELEETTTCGNPSLKAKHNSCPFENSISDTTPDGDSNVYIYTKPFSNFTKFGFKMEKFFYPTLEHLIMHLRLWTLVDEPMRNLAEEDPEDPYVLRYLEEMELDSVEDLLDEDPRELAYVVIHRAIFGNWNTEIMKRCVVARHKRYSDLTTPLLEDILVERTSTLYQYALHRKILSSPSLTYFFLIHKDFAWYEVAPIDSVWVINEQFDPEKRGDTDYLDRLDEAAKRDGPTKNVFGKYLKVTAEWIGNLEQKDQGDRDDQ